MGVFTLFLNTYLNTGNTKLIGESKRVGTPGGENE